MKTRFSRTRISSRIAKPAPNPARGFTLIELLVVVSIIALLVSILLPSLSRARELANRAVCAANVRGIMQSMEIYGQENDNVLPCVKAPASATFANNPSPATTGVIDPSTALQGYYNAGAATGSPYQAGSPSACMWLMVARGGQIVPKLFLCKSDTYATTPSPQYVTGSTIFNNFAATGLSYSIAFPWNGTANGGWWTVNSGTDVPLTSDMAPMQDTASSAPTKRDLTTPLGGTGAPAIYNSGNHGGDGQNVGFGDTHVDWTKHPFVAQQGNNIFTAGVPTGVSGGTPVAITINTSGTVPTLASASNPFDIVMLPARNVNAGGM